MAPTIEERLTALEKENTEIRKENLEIKRRLSTVEGQFEFISGQLRDAQLYMHARFEQVDRRFEQVEKRLDKVERDIATFRTEVNRRFDELPTMVRDVMRRADGYGAPLALFAYAARPLLLAVPLALHAGVWWRERHAARR